MQLQAPVNAPAIAAPRRLTKFAFFYRAIPGNRSISTTQAANCRATRLVIPALWITALSRCRLEKVHRNLDVADAIIFRWWKLPSPHIDLHGGEDEPWHVECGIAPFACLDELILGDAIVDCQFFGFKPPSLDGKRL
jgi:hypothetical protein